MLDPINYPQHYLSHPSGIECIEVTEHMGFCLGNAIKYIWRADLKGGIQDLEKAVWYIEREIAKRKIQGPNVENSSKNLSDPDLNRFQVTADEYFKSPDGQLFETLEEYDEYVNEVYL